MQVGQVKERGLQKSEDIREDGQQAERSTVVNAEIPNTKPQHCLNVVIAVLLDNNVYFISVILEMQNLLKS